MANETPAQVKDNQDGGPATVEAWQDEHGGTNLPDNPAYTAPPVSPELTAAQTDRARHDERANDARN